jgi:hypothetical protein
MLPMAGALASVDHAGFNLPLLKSLLRSLRDVLWCRSRQNRY